MMDPRDLDPVVHQPTRLAILGALQRNREMAAVELRELLDLTPGNLGSHVARLEGAGYVETRRALAGLSFEVRHRLTTAGTRALLAYLSDLAAVLGDLGAAADVGPGARPISPGGTGGTGSTGDPGETTSEPGR